jgi:hypothetical protein
MSTALRGDSSWCCSLLLTILGSPQSKEKVQELVILEADQADYGPSLSE